MNYPLLWREFSLLCVRFYLSFIGFIELFQSVLLVNKMSYLSKSIASTNGVNIDLMVLSCVGELYFEYTVYDVK